jgi:hypothetical protein
MKTAHRKPAGIARVIVVAAALVGVVVLPSARAATPSHLVTAVANGGIPAVVNPTADLVTQVPGPELTWIDSIFIAGRVHGDGHNFGILVHTIAFPNVDQGKLWDITECCGRR